MVAAEKINDLYTILHGVALREFYKLASQNAGTNNAHLKFIQEGLLGYFFLINTLSNHKCMMRCAMSKPQDLPFKHFPACLAELNNYLHIYPGYITSK